MDERHLTAAKKLSKARAQLVLKSPFFGSLAMRMQIIEDPKYPYIVTDGVSITYNPAWIKQWTVQQCIGILAHEVSHIALKHHLRCQSRQFELWNIACDYAADPILTDYDYQLPWGGHVEKRFSGMSAEKIYAIIEKEMPEWQGKSISGKPSGGNKNGLESHQENGQDNRDNRNNSGNNSEDNESRKKMLKGHEGLVTDAPINLKDKKQLQVFEEELDIIIEQSIKIARDAGKMPGNLEKILTADRMHVIDYTENLRNWLEKSVFGGDYNWLKPDRAYIGYDMMLPGVDDDYDKPKIVFAIDSSGSIGIREKQIATNEISGVLEEFDAEIMAIYCDTEIRNVQMLSSDDFPVKLHWKGGGGTNFKPIFDHIREEGVDCEAIMFFTDMATSDWNKLKDPGIPVLWMNTANYYNKIPPFGTMIRVDLKGKK